MVVVVVVFGESALFNIALVLLKCCESLVGMSSKEGYWHRNGCVAVVAAAAVVAVFLGAQKASCDGVGRFATQFQLALVHEPMISVARVGVFGHD